MIVPVSFEGIEKNESGMIAEKDLMELLESRIRMLPDLEKEYEAEELDSAA